MWDELQEVNEIATIINSGFAGLEPFQHIKVVIDLDEEFDLIDENGDSIPIVMLEIDSMNTTSSGAKGQMINGVVTISCFVIVGKANRKFAVYYKELTQIVAKLREIFQMTPDKRIQYMGTQYVNYYKLGSYPAVGASVLINLPVGNCDYRYGV